MLAGTTAEEKETLALGDAREYAFLTKVPQSPSAVSQCGGDRHGNPNLLQGACVECEGRDDAEIYQDVRSAMELFFSDSQRRDILKLLAAILHLGNVYFQGERQQTHSGGFLFVLIVVVSCGTRQHTEQPGNLPRQQIGTLPRRRLAAGGERFLFCAMVFSVIFYLF